MLKSLVIHTLASYPMDILGHCSVRTDVNILFRMTFPLKYWHYVKAIALYKNIIQWTIYLEINFYFKIISITHIRKMSIRAFSIK